MPIAGVNGYNMNYAFTGQGDPLVLIMGLGNGQQTWRFNIPAFKKYYRVITFDNRGVGNSGEGPSSVRQMADDTVGLMDHLGIEKAHILGVSLGGTIAQEMAINYPNRVDKLILGSTCACHDESNGFTPEFAKAMETFIHTRKAPSVKLIVNKWPYQILSFFLMNRQYNRMNDTGRAGFAAQWKAGGKHNTLNQLSRIKAPTLVITGTGDKAIRSSSSDTLARLIPNAKLTKIENGSHGLFIEMRGRFNREVLDFLKSS